MLDAGGGDHIKGNERLIKQILIHALSLSSVATVNACYGRNIKQEDPTMYNTNV